jgi:Ca2+-binding RTX toxin-like protein
VRHSLLALILLAAFAFPVGATPTCTSIGTAEHDTINGDTKRDIICLKGGRDYGNGKGAADVVRGGRGVDTLVGGDGADVIRGGYGADDIFAVDDTPNDHIFAGPGDDNCYADTGDEVRECEHVIRVA